VRAETHRDGDLAEHVVGAPLSGAVDRAGAMGADLVGAGVTTRRRLAPLGRGGGEGRAEGRERGALGGGAGTSRLSHPKTSNGTRVPRPESSIGTPRAKSRRVGVGGHAPARPEHRVDPAVAELQVP
jgi:hypothetical protein